MVAMAVQSQFSVLDSVKLKSWTAEDWREVRVSLVQTLGLVCGAALLYSLGPVLGMTLIVAGIAAWSLRKKQTATGNDEGDPAEARGQVATADSPSHCSNPAWLRGGRLAMCIESAACRSTARCLMRKDKTMEPHLIGVNLWNKLIAASAAMAAAGILTCAAAPADGLLPRESFAAFLTSMALIGLAVTGVVIGYTWACDKCEGYFQGRLDRLLGMNKPERSRHVPVKKQKTPWTLQFGYHR